MKTNELNIKKGLTPILPVKRGNYFYVARHVTAGERATEPNRFPVNIKYVMITNTAFNSFEKCAKEMARIINRDHRYCMYKPTQNDIEQQHLQEVFSKVNPTKNQ